MEHKDIVLDVQKLNTSFISDKKEVKIVKDVSFQLKRGTTLAIVGDPTRSSGFVLSREPSLDNETWAEVRDVIEDRGWWSCAFFTVPMAGGKGDAAPLCLLP